MYLTVTAQKTDGNFRQSSSDFINYLDKENEDKELVEREPFFSQNKDIVSRFEVVQNIDNNTKKLKTKEPKYYSITLNPSFRELKHIENNTDALKEYTRKAMEQYAASFNRSIGGRYINADDIEKLKSTIVKGNNFGSISEIKSLLKENSKQVIELEKLLKTEKETFKADVINVKLKHINNDIQVLKNAQEYNIVNDLDKAFKDYSIATGNFTPTIKDLDNHLIELRKMGSTDDAIKLKDSIKNYTDLFSRTIEGRAVKASDIMYYGKVEKKRSYKYTDPKVKENKELLKKISLSNSKKERALLKGKLNYDSDVLIKEGMLKSGNQSHIHLIVSRKDITNSYSLSPGSNYKSSMNYKPSNKQLESLVTKRGFNRDGFFEKAEASFDKHLKYNRNYVESYKGLKDLKYSPKRFFSKLTGLPTSQKAVGFRILAENKIPMLKHIPLNQADLVKKAIDKALQIGKKLLQAGELSI